MRWSVQQIPVLRAPANLIISDCVACSPMSQPGATRQINLGQQIPRAIYMVQIRLNPHRVQMQGTFQYQAAPTFPQELTPIASDGIQALPTNTPPETPSGYCNSATILLNRHAAAHNRLNPSLAQLPRPPGHHGVTGPPPKLCAGDPGFSWPHQPDCFLVTITSISTPQHNHAGARR